MKASFFRVALLASLLVVPGVLAAQQKVVELESPWYLEIENLFIARGRAVPFAARPWTVEEFLSYYRMINAAPPAELLAMNGSSAMYREAARPADDPADNPAAGPADGSAEQSGLGINVLPGAALELYLKADRQPDDSESSFELPWFYGYGERLSLVSLGVDFFLGHGLYAGGSLDLKQERFAAHRLANYSNFNSDFGYYDVQFPFRAYISAGGSNWNLLAGRNELTLGPGRSGQLVVSGEPDWVDQVRFTSFWRNFKYTGALIYIQPYLSAAEESVVQGYTGDPVIPSRYISFHRFDMRFFDRWNLGITEGLSWGGRPLDIRFLNPVMIMHNFYEWDFAASLFSLDTQIVPLPGLMLYGQFMFNAIQSRYEAERYGADTTPPAMGWMAGIQGSLPGQGASQGDSDAGRLSLSGGFEYVHTDPWLYIREHAYNSYIWRRKAISNLAGSNPLVDAPLGFLWGPDTDLYMLWADGVWPVSSSMDLKLDALLSLVYDGEQELSTPYASGPEAISMITPTGTAEVWRIISLKPRLLWQPGSGAGGTRHSFEFAINGDIFWVDNYAHEAGRRAFDVQLALSASWRILEW